MNNNRLLLVTVVFAFMISGCSLIPRFPSTPGNQPKQKFHHSEKMRTEPKIIEIIDSEGRVIKAQIGEVTTKSYDVALETVIPKPSFFRRVWNLFGWPIILITAFVLFVPGGGVIFGMIFKRASGVLKKGFSQTTRGIETFLESDADEESKKKLLKNLSNAMDEDTKETVSKLKRTNGV